MIEGSRLYLIVNGLDRKFKILHWDLDKAQKSLTLAVPAHPIVAGRTLGGKNS